MKRYKTLDACVQSLDKSKFTVPEKWEATSCIPMPDHRVFTCHTIAYAAVSRHRDQGASRTLLNVLLIHELHTYMCVISLCV